MSASSPGTGSLDSDKKIAELEKEIENLKSIINRTYSLSGGIPIPANADLDDYITPGNYYCNQNSIAITIKNCPITNAFTLKVEDATGTAYPCQTIRDFRLGTLYYRFFNTTGGWAEFRHSTLV